jgi:hypothetical protein
MRTAGVLVLLTGLNACSDVMVNASFKSNFLPPAGTAVTGAKATLTVSTTNTTSPAVAFASLLLFAAAVSDESSRPAPELDPDRKISEQDCTRPVDYSLGNIRCSAGPPSVYYARTGPGLPSSTR